MTVLHLFAKACQTSVLSVGPTWPWWKYFKGDVWPYLITLRLAVAVPHIIKILSVCLEQTAGMCIFLSHLCTLLGWRMFMAGPETLWSMLACMPSKIVLSHLWVTSWLWEMKAILVWQLPVCTSVFVWLCGLEKPHRLLWKHQFLYW